MNCSECQNKQKNKTICVLLSLEFSCTEQWTRNSMNNPSLYCGLVDTYKNKCFWKSFTSTQVVSCHTKHIFHCYKGLNNELFGDMYFFLFLCPIVFILLIAMILFEKHVLLEIAKILDQTNHACVPKLEILQVGWIHKGTSINDVRFRVGRGFIKPQNIGHYRVKIVGPGK